jgi:dextranase
VLLNVQPDRACYRPGETVRLVASLSSPTAVEAGAGLRIVGSILFLADKVAHLSATVPLLSGQTRVVELAWMPPPMAPRGYGVDLQVLDGSGRVLAASSTAFDVLERWTQAPRYGFLSDFWSDRTDRDQTMRWLARYHINGLQFYDWMYRHDQLLPPEDVFDDPLGRRQSLATVLDLIDAAHDRGVAAMPYTAIYAASLPFFQQHLDWALCGAEGQPIPFGEDFLMIMNPAPGSAWIRHLLGQFAEVLDKTAFDGIHLDQYGDPKVGYDAHGNRLDLAEVIPQLIDLIRETAIRARPDAAVVFNCVGNWPIERAAESQQDFMYVEVWPPYTRYSDLYSLVVEGQAHSGGKPVVLAAYIDPARARNARLADAVILASGGYHIELGEPGMMLADPYFPNYGPMSDELAAVIRRYYDFAVRYENILALNTRDATPAFEGKVHVEGLSTDAGRTCNKVWPIVRAGDGALGLSLINLLGLSSPEWNDLLEADPPVQEDLLVRIDTEQSVRRVWWATPDGDHPAGQELEFSTGWDQAGAHVMLRVPRLAYWDLIVLELEDGRQETP